MADIHSRLLQRELRGSNQSTNVKVIYSNPRWVRDLDIVKELNGHSGCVNTLAWSKSGRFLASGSDDTHLNIHEYLGCGTNDSFKLATSVHTGHRANIFSVKFMPHSNDRTLVTAAGDSQIRVFDIEYSAASSNLTLLHDIASPSMARDLASRGFQMLGEKDTNARIYRCHSDRVKRIVTESSPHLFLSCSEDGEVRQWDLRLPSSAYPRPRGDGWSTAAGDDDGVPPPLISYKRHRLDLNTISCSPSQPHYIALGGAHLYCFLHDRRMMGRDRDRERGRPSSVRNATEHDDDFMREATQCVKRFAPHPSKYQRDRQGHITACKISDARPNEMIVSWSADAIYAFDLVRSPDASESARQAAATASVKDRKRKRGVASAIPLEEVRRTSSRPQSRGGDMDLRVHYGNGQSDTISLQDPYDAFTEADRVGINVAYAMVMIKKRMLSPRVSRDPWRVPTDVDPTGHAMFFTSALGFSADILDDMDEAMRAWRYPVDPDDDTVARQTTWRRHRESTRRFVQASGSLARVLGGRLRSTRVRGNGQRPRLSHFINISPAPNESNILDRSEQFCYDFVKAIIAWLDSGPGALLEQFSHPGNKARFPIPSNAGIEAIDEVFFPYLFRLASERPVPNVDASRFEVDGNRRVFVTEHAAVVAFAMALRIPFEDLNHASQSGPSSSDRSLAIPSAAFQDRRTALRFWGFKVARGLLHNASSHIHHESAACAFGATEIAAAQGSGPPGAEDLGGMVDDDERDEILGESSDDSAMQDSDSSDSDSSDSEGADQRPQDVEAVNFEDTERARRRPQEDEDVDVDDESIEGSDDMDTQGSDSSDSDSEEEGEDWQPSDRNNINRAVPSVPWHRSYAGHVNVQTVKDVNYYGPNDEYVVSGSDDGSLFIWDRLSSQLLNILEGDEQTVNVAQGHPYEPMLAVSGIDHTIKIFSADAKARRQALQGATSYVYADDSHDLGCLDAYQSDDSNDTNYEPESPEALRSRRRMHDVYRITSENDEALRGGGGVGRHARPTIIPRELLAELAAQMRLRFADGRVGGHVLGTDAHGGPTLGGVPFSLFLPT